MAVLIGFCGVRTVRRKWIEHSCSKCGELLAKYHPALQPSTHGKVRHDMQPDGETEVIAYAA
jgi:hypothetical protein